MSHPIKLAIQPGQTVRFPGRCVHCGRPATERLDISLRKQQLTRSVEVPLCAACKRETQRRSGREEQLVRLGWIAAPLAAVLVLLGVWLLSASLPTGLRVLLGLALAAATAAATLGLFRRMARTAELPEKRAVMTSARIDDFSWRTMTFDFTDEPFAHIVSELNSDSPTEELLAAGV